MISSRKNAVPASHRGVGAWACLGACAVLTMAAGTTASAQVSLSGRGADAPTPRVESPMPLFEGEMREGPSARALHLRAATVPAFMGKRDFAERCGDIKRAGARWVVQLDGPMTKQRRKRLAEAGIEVGDYLPTNAFVVRLDKADPEAARGIDFIRWHCRYEPEWKIAPEIGDFERADKMAMAGEREVIVSLFEGEPLERLLDALDELPEAVVFHADVVGGNVTADMVLSEGSIRRLAEMDFVAFIEPALEATPRNDTDSWVIQSNVNGYEPVHDAGIHGEGQVLGHMDGRLNASHCSFLDASNPIGPSHRKILAYNATAGTSDTHGTHTAGTAVGDDPGSAGNLDGIAFAAKIVHNTTPAFSETAFTDRLETHHEQGARVHTNSWGNDGSTTYNAWARAVDVFSHDYEDSLVCFAVTNLSTLKTPENAKNCLAVGASQDAAGSNSFCSGGAGPTNDGRRKPEIFAPGCSITSANTTACGTTSLTGTSMACPGVAGAGLLVRQYYTDGFYPSGVANPSDALTPTGALIKATLLNSAQNMTSYGTGYPNNQEGWGRALLDAALYFDREPADTRRMIVKDIRNTDDDGALETGEQDFTMFRVTGSAEQLRVTMVFTDKEGGVNANPAPVNNLNLLVTSPSGVEYRGNVFGASGVSTTGGSNDAINNVEQVHLNAPEVGVWTARVTAQAVNSVEDQGFALVVTGEVAPAVACDGDVNGDFVVNTADLGVLIEQFGTAGPEGDLNGDGQVNTADLGVLIALFGVCE